MRKVAIFIVNGFDRRNRWGLFNAQEAIKYPWIDLCLRQITRHSQTADYNVHIYDNARLLEHRQLILKYPNVIIHPHGWKSILKLWIYQQPYQLMNFMRQFFFSHNKPYLLPFWELSHPVALDWLVAHLDDDIEYFITLDSDSFPVRDNWIESLIDHLQNGARMCGVLRDELAPKIKPFIHVSCLCVRTVDFRTLSVSFSRGMAKDVGQNITIEMEKQMAEIVPLKRSNIKNFHYLMGGVYGNLIYHHGAGSRHAKFWTSSDKDVEEEERTRIMLRNRVFENIELLIEELTGSLYNS